MFNYVQNLGNDPETRLQSSSAISPESFRRSITEVKALSKSLFLLSPNEIPTLTETGRVNAPCLSLMRFTACICERCQAAYSRLLFRFRKPHVDGKLDIAVA